jgi:hypothetical protein
MVLSNYGIGNIGLSISNGIVNIELTSEDYPKITIAEYGNKKKYQIGERLTLLGMIFYLESISNDIPTMMEGDLLTTVTRTYVHISKKTYEDSISVLDFVEAKKNTAKSKTEDSYIFSIGQLISFAKGTVIVDDFDVEFSKQPSREETVTLKQLCDPMGVVNGKLAYIFGRESISFGYLGISGLVPWKSTSNVTITKNIQDTYKDTVLTWTKAEDSKTNSARKVIKLRTAKYCLYEGDFNPHIAPPETSDNSKFPRDLSVMIDNSGTTKQFKITLYEHGQPNAELSGVFGFAHAALELVADPEQPNAQSSTVLEGIAEDVLTTGNAYQELLSSIKAQKYGYPDDANFSNGMVWRCLELKKTTYIYESFSPSITPYIRNQNGTLEPIEIDSEYRKVISSNIEVLVAKETVGWEIKRFAQEDSSNWTDGSINAWLQLKGLIDLKDTLAQGDKESTQLYNLSLYQAKVGLEQYLYRKIPIFERTDYAIKPFSRFYKDGDDVNWDIEYIPKSGTSLGGGSGEVIPVLFPDVDWMPELMLISESRYKSSVGVSGNPAYNPLARNYFGSNPISITTGSEEYEFTKYTVLPSKNTKYTIGNYYQEYTNVSDVINSVNSSQGIGGTYYKPHEYMTVNDYGLIGVNPETISMGEFSNIYPTTLSRREDMYLSQSSFRNAQDNSYKSFVTNSTYSISQGRPPSATVRKALYEEVKGDGSVYADTTTLISCSSSTVNSKVVPSINVDGAKTKQQAIIGAKNSLVKSIFSSGASASGILNFTLFKTLSLPSLVNAKIAIPGSRESWVTKRVSLSVHYSNSIPFAQQIGFDAGILSTIDLRDKTVPNVSTSGSNKSVKIEIEGNTSQNFGVSKDKINSNFARWVDIN